MANRDFILRSGAKLHITTAPFEDAVSLMEAVKAVTRGLAADVEMGDVALTSPEVRKASYGCMAFATYEAERLSPAFFDDPRFADRARSDYPEIIAKLVEVNVLPFFFNTSSASSASAATGSAPPA